MGSDFYEYDEDWDLDFLSDAYSYEADFDYDDLLHRRRQNLPVKALRPCVFPKAKRYPRKMHYAEDISDVYSYERDFGYDNLLHRHRKNLPVKAFRSCVYPKAKRYPRKMHYVENISDCYKKKKKKKKSDCYVYEQDWDHSYAYVENLSDCYASKTEVSNVDNSAEALDLMMMLHLLNRSDLDVCSLNKLKSMEDTSQTVENGDTECTNISSTTEASNILIKETQQVKEIIDVNGFQVFPSQVESVSYIFKRHPDIALGFRPKNQQIRRAYMSELLNLIETLCQSPEKPSEDDLSNADETLVDLIDVGFKLDWLKIKLNEVSEKKKMEQCSEVRLQTMEEQLQKLKQMVLDLEFQLQKAKAEALVLRAPLSFNDVVC